MTEEEVLSRRGLSEDSLGDRMKRYEDVNRHTLTPRMPAILRVDGRAFHSYTRGCDRPFDERLMMAMDRVALKLCHEVTNARCAYVQSDEISILMTDYATHDTQPWFGGNIQKIVSVAASMAAVHLTLESPTFHPLCLDDMMAYGPIPCEFDARVFAMPKEDVANYFVWRQQDWTRNSLQMLSRSLYSHSELKGKNQAAMHEMCFQKGKNWADLSPVMKNGRWVVKRDTTTFVDKGPMAGRSFTRPKWTTEAAPNFKSGVIEDLL